MDKIILIRLDKIGDLIATLPIDQVQVLKNYQTTWIVEESVNFLCELSEPPRVSFTLSLKNKMAAFEKLLFFLKSEKPSLVVIFYAPWWVSLATWLAEVPQRVGRKSQWHSFLFLTRSLRQSRSLSEKHEVEYNWELLNFALKNQTQEQPPFFKLQARLQRQLFERFSLHPKNYVVVHPGMAGSALNWPQKKYNELIKQLVMMTPVVITGTKMDHKWLNQMEYHWKNHPNVKWLIDQLEISELIFILQNATAVVAPSTGVLHLAAAAGAPVVGIYSNLLPHHPRRWGPRGFGVKVVTPNFPCEFDNPLCMDSITVSDVIKCLNL